MVNGDDLIISFDVLPFPTMAETTKRFLDYESGCGIKPEGKVFDDVLHTSFLSAKFFATNDGGILFAPSPGRMLQRLNWTCKDVPCLADWRRATALSIASVGLQVPIVRALIISMVPELQYCDLARVKDMYEASLARLPLAAANDLRRREHLQYDFTGVADWMTQGAVPIWHIAERYGISEGQIHSLEDLILTYAGMPVIIKNHLAEWIISCDGADPALRPLF